MHFKFERTDKNKTTTTYIDSLTITAFKMLYEVKASYEKDDEGRR